MKSIKFTLLIAAIAWLGACVAKPLCDSQSQILIEKCETCEQEHEHCYIVQGFKEQPCEVFKANRKL